MKRLHWSIIVAAIVLGLGFTGCGSNKSGSDFDGDGIPDSVEQSGPMGDKDIDGDGLPNWMDDDSDGDGIPDSVEAGDDPEHPRDTDGDGIADYEDVDSDNDGVSDKVEGVDDCNHNGIPNYIDPNDWPNADGTCRTADGGVDADADSDADTDADGDADANMNNPPVITLDPTTTTYNIDENTSTPLTFSASFSDPDGDNVTLNVKTLPDFITVSPSLPATSGPVTFTAKPGCTDLGEYDIALVATDDNPDPLSSVKVVRINVVQTNCSGTLSLDSSNPPPLSADETTSKDFKFAFTDPEGDRIDSMAFVGDVPAALNVSLKKVGTDWFVSVTADCAAVNGSPYSFTVNATDNGNPAGAVSNNLDLSISINETNCGPIIQVTPQTATVMEKGSAQILIVGTDPDGDTPLYLNVIAVTPNGVLALADTKNVTLTETGAGTWTLDFNPDYVQNGDYTFQFTLGDRNPVTTGLTDYAEASVTVLDKSGTIEGQWPTLGKNAEHRQAYNSPDHPYIEWTFKESNDAYSKFGYYGYDYTPLRQMWNSPAIDENGDFLYAANVNGYLYQIPLDPDLSSNMYFSEYGYYLSQDLWIDNYNYLNQYVGADYYFKNPSELTKADRAYITQYAEPYPSPVIGPDQFYVSGLMNLGKDQRSFYAWDNSDIELDGGAPQALYVGLPEYFTQPPHAFPQRDYTYATPTVSALEQVYVPLKSGFLASFDAQNGDLVWIFDMKLPSEDYTDIPSHAVPWEHQEVAAVDSDVDGDKDMDTKAAVAAPVQYRNFTKMAGIPDPEHGRATPAVAPNGLIVEPSGNFLFGIVPDDKKDATYSPKLQGYYASWMESPSSADGKLVEWTYVSTPVIDPAQDVAYFTAIREEVSSTYGQLKFGGTNPCANGFAVCYNTYSGGGSCQDSDIAACFTGSQTCQTCYYNGMGCRSIVTDNGGGNLIRNVACVNVSTADLTAYAVDLKDFSLVTSQKLQDVSLFVPVKQAAGPNAYPFNVELLPAPAILSDSSVVFVAPSFSNPLDEPPEVFLYTAANGFQPFTLPAGITQIMTSPVIDGQDRVILVAEEEVAPLDTEYGFYDAAQVLKLDPTKLADPLMWSIDLPASIRYMSGYNFAVMSPKGMPALGPFNAEQVDEAKGCIYVASGEEMLPVPTKAGSYNPGMGQVYKICEQPEFYATAGENNRRSGQQNVDGPSSGLYQQFLQSAYYALGYASWHGNDFSPLVQSETGQVYSVVSSWRDYGYGYASLFLFDPQYSWNQSQFAPVLLTSRAISGWESSNSFSSGSIGGPTLAPDGTLYVGLNFMYSSMSGYGYFYYNTLAALDPQRVYDPNYQPYSTPNTDTYVKWFYPQDTLTSHGYYSSHYYAPFADTFVRDAVTIRPQGPIYTTPLVHSKTGLVYYTQNEVYPIPSYSYYGSPMASDASYLAYVVAMNPNGHPVYMSPGLTSIPPDAKIKAKDGVAPFEFIGSPIELPGDRIALTANDGKLYVYNLDLTLVTTVSLAQNDPDEDGSYYVSTPVLSGPSTGHADGVIYVASVGFETIVTGKQAATTYLNEYVFAIDASTYALLTPSWGANPVQVAHTDVTGYGTDFPNYYTVRMPAYNELYLFLIPRPVLSGDDVFVASVSGDLYRLGFLSGSVAPVSIMAYDPVEEPTAYASYNTQTPAMDASGYLYWSTVVAYNNPTKDPGSSSYQWYLIRVDSLDFDDFNRMGPLSISAAWSGPTHGTSSLASPIVGQESDLFLGSPFVGTHPEYLGTALYWIYED